MQEEVVMLGFKWDELLLFAFLFVVVSAVALYGIDNNIMARLGSI